MKPYEDKIIFGLIRLFQLIFVVLFSLLVLTYYSSLLLAPLFLMFQALPLLKWVFDGGGAAILILIAVLVYSANFLNQQRRIFDLISGTGKELIRMGRSRYDAFEQVIHDLKS